MTGHLDIKDLEKMKKDDLKALAKDMGISDEGTVKELAARIAAEEVEVPEEDELTEEEKRFLIQGYFDRSETVYDTPEKWNSAPCIEKCSLLQKLEERYLAGIPRELLEELHIRPEER